jgi:hypothetical protein
MATFLQAVKRLQKQSPHKITITLSSLLTDCQLAGQINGRAPPYQLRLRKQRRQTQQRPERRSRELWLVPEAETLHSKTPPAQTTGAQSLRRTMVLQRIKPSLRCETHLRGKWFQPPCRHDLIVLQTRRKNQRPKSRRPIQRRAPQDQNR